MTGPEACGGSQGTTLVLGVGRGEDDPTSPLSPVTRVPPNQHWYYELHGPQHAPHGQRLALGLLRHNESSQNHQPTH